MFTLILTLLLNQSYAADKVPKGKIESPYEACKGTLIVDTKKYNDNKSQWDQVQKDCKTKIQLSTDISAIGRNSIDPIHEGVQYLEFLQRVGKKINENLEKSRKYAECSASCFSGEKVCIPALSVDAKIVQCDDRKKEIVEAMKIQTRKIRMELALSTDAPGLSTVNMQNVLTVDKSKFINSNLRDFEIGTPNPVGRNNLTERELSIAQRRSESERKKFEAEFKEKGYTNYHDWMSIKLLTNFEDHQAKYRSLIYEESPIFGVIDSPKFDERNDPVWKDAQVAAAFRKLSANAVTTKAKVNWSLKNSVIEFSRPEAVGRFLVSLVPFTKDKVDLLDYMSMKNPIEEVLKEDPGSCAIATALDARLTSKVLQNAGLTLAGTVASLGTIRAGGAAVGRTILIGRAITGAEAAGLTGMALGATYLRDNFKNYNTLTDEAATTSGLGGDNEGKKLITGAAVNQARDNVKMSLMFAPLDASGGWGAGKVFYNSLSKRMIKDLPEVAELAKRAEIDVVARDQLVDKWLTSKFKAAVKGGFLQSSDEALLQTKKGREVFNKLVESIEKTDKDFFKNPNNMEFFLKSAVAQLKKEKGDPADLGEKVTSLLLSLNKEIVDDTMDASSKAGLGVVFDSAVTELRESYKKDPALYAKFTTDKNAQQTLVTRAMKRIGIVDEKDAQAAAACML